MDNDFLVIEVQGVAKREAVAACKRLIKVYEQTYMKEMGITAADKVFYTRMKERSQRYYRALIDFVEEYIQHNKTIMSKINALVTKTKNELIAATPVSQKRKRYFKGTHQDHGATKKGWSVARQRGASSATFIISNKYPDRVRFVEHGFARPAKHRMEPHPADPSKLMGMAWQMDTDPSVVITHNVRALSRYPGKFFVKKQYDALIGKVSRLLKTQANWINRVTIDYGTAYTYK